MKTDKKYEWVIVGGGITGIALSEILTREGHSVLLIEKNEQLASGTTRDFHEWMHTGSLYTLVPDKLVTLKYILGAVDDLLEYYSSFKNMNLKPTENGLEIEKNDGWFNKNYIHFKYRVKGRKLTFPWLLGIARSKFLIEYLNSHDWLRRKAGVIEDFGSNYIKDVFQTFLKLIRFDKKFLSVKTPDFTMDSRVLLRDLIATSIHHGLDVSLGNKVLSIDEINNTYIVKTEKGEIESDNIILSCAENIKEFLDVSIKTSYAPMAVVDNLPSKANSFVELDYFTKNCINLLTKDHKIGLIGGITVDKKEDTQSYIEYVKREHKKLFPDMTVLDDYVGLKNEIVFKNQDRNYLYHIVKEADKNIWSVVPGKFSLAFSLAPEFYRQIYKKNPRKFFTTYEDNGDYKKYVSETVWMDLVVERKNNE